MVRAPKKELRTIARNWFFFVPADMISPHFPNHNPLAPNARDDGRPWKSVM
jgi:hypothetical protein